MNNQRLLELYELALDTWDRDEDEDINQKSLNEAEQEVYNHLLTLAIWENSNLEDRLDIIKWEDGIQNLRTLNMLASKIFDRLTLDKWRTLVTFDTQKGEMEC